MRRIMIAAAAGAAMLALSACATTEGADAGPSASAAPAAPVNTAAIEAGQSVFQTRCSGCHRASGGSAPAPSVIGGLSHDAIVAALTTGKMAAQGRALSDEDKSNVATFLRSGGA